MAPSRSARRTADTKTELVDEVALLLLRTVDEMVQCRDRLAAEYELTPALAKALRHLDVGEAVAMRELADRLNYDPSNLTGLVDRLEARGIVERRPHPTDRRIKALVLTTEGARLRDEFWNRLLSEGCTVSRLRPDQLTLLRDLLHEARAAHTTVT